MVGMGKVTLQKWLNFKWCLFICRCGYGISFSLQCGVLALWLACGDRSTKHGNIPQRTQQVCGLHCRAGRAWPLFSPNYAQVVSDTIQEPRQSVNSLSTDFLVVQEIGNTDVHVGTRLCTIIIIIIIIINEKINVAFSRRTTRTRNSHNNTSRENVVSNSTEEEKIVMKMTARRAVSSAAA